MARSFLPILLLAIIGVTAGFMKAAVPIQETAAAATKSAAIGNSFDTGLDNPSIQSDMNIHPARKCGFCMGVSALF